MRVLLTGASGFLGSWALRALIDRGAEVYAASRRRPDVDADFVWLELDLLDTASPRAAVAAARPEAVLHLAWTIIDQGAFWTSPLNLAWVGASLRLAEAIADHGARRFIAAGTCYEYDWPHDADCEEDTTPLQPSTLYDVSKDATRRVLSTFLANRGVDFAWARLFYLYGPGEPRDRLVPSICRAVAADTPVRCSRGLAVRDYMDVRDAGAALATLVGARVTGAVNVATGDRISIAQIARRLGELAGRPDLIRLGAQPDRPNEPPRITATGQRLRTTTGFAPTRTLDQGLADSLRYWKDRHAETDPA